MRKISCFSVFLILISCSLSGWAREVVADDTAKSGATAGLAEQIDSAVAPVEREKLFSPSVAQVLHEIAYELANSKNISGSEAREAVVLLKAAMELDSGADYVRPTLIKLACRSEQEDYSGMVRQMLADYMDNSADLEVASRAVDYLFGRTNSREERERLLAQLLQDIGNKNDLFGSGLATMLAMLMAEKPDESAAGFYLVQAYKHNKHNKVAFGMLAGLFPDKLSPGLYLEHLRLALREDPSNINIALSLARYTEQMGLYDTATDAYQYCADLFTYLYPAESLPARIYLPWAISSYNTKENQQKCLQIAELVRQSGQFNLGIEALAGKAAAKLGDGQKATETLQAAEEKARQLLMQGPEQNTTAAELAEDGDMQRIRTTEFAWFYCFVLPNPELALDWANKAYSTEPNSPSVAGILAYALVMNKQTDWAKTLIKDHNPTQISDLALAQIHIAEGKKDLAMDALKFVIAKDPGSLAAERAKEIIAQQGGEYIPPIIPEIIIKRLERVFGKGLIPAFVPPEQLFSVQFNIRGNKFQYGSEFGGVIAIVNNSSEPLVIGSDGLLKGDIRIDADVTGDFTKKIPELVSFKFRTGHLVAPGRSIFIPVRLITGELRKMLLTYPQASLDIEFTLYIDPVITKQGQVSNRVSKTEPVKLLVKRQGIELTGKYLRYRFNLVSTGHREQKLKTAQLFIGLLREQYAMSGRTPPYRFMYEDWMPRMFKNALIHESGLLRNPTEGEWVVKMHTMAEMLSLPMDHEMVNAVAGNINNSNWPVRMMAIYLLAKAQKGQFGKVLEWAAQNDPDNFVREMAAALIASASELSVPANLPSLDEQLDKLLLMDKR